MADFMLWALVEMLSAFISAWLNGGAPRGFLVGTLLMSLGLPILSMLLLHPIIRALCWGGTALAWVSFIAVLAIGKRVHEKSPGRFPPGAQFDQSASDD